nr:MAG TPA: hypothetical protein [Caudoviricetes sp.]
MHLKNSTFYSSMKKRQHFCCLSNLISYYTL